MRSIDAIRRKELVASTIIAALDRLEEFKAFPTVYVGRRARGMDSSQRDFPCAQCSSLRILRGFCAISVIVCCLWMGNRVSRAVSGAWSRVGEGRRR